MSTVNIHEMTDEQFADHVKAVTSELRSRLKDTDADKLASGLADADAERKQAERVVKLARGVKNTYAAEIRRREAAVKRAAEKREAAVKAAAEKGPTVKWDVPIPCGKYEKGKNAGRNKYASGDHKRMQSTAKLVGVGASGSTDEIRGRILSLKADVNAYRLANGMDTPPAPAKPEPKADATPKQAVAAKKTKPTAKPATNKRKKANLAKS